MLMSSDGDLILWKNISDWSTRSKMSTAFNVVNENIMLLLSKCIKFHLISYWIYRWMHQGIVCEVAPSSETTSCVHFLQLSLLQRVNAREDLRIFSRVGKWIRQAIKQSKNGQTILYSQKKRFEQIKLEEYFTSFDLAFIPLWKYWVRSEGHVYA